ncbi:hypothetical protein ACFYYN_16800 [Streptomyces sp. NPDC001902]
MFRRGGSGGVADRATIAGTANALFNNKGCAVVGADGRGHTVAWNRPMAFVASKGDHC